MLITVQFLPLVDCSTIHLLTSLLVRNTNKTILTAAHCVDPKNGVPVDKVYVTAAEHDKDSDDHTEIRIVSESIHLHPGYVNSGLRRDVAIVKLAEALPIGDRGSNRAFKVRGRKKS